MEMDALSIVASLLIIILLFSLRYLITQNRGPNHKKLPEPTNGWPVIGHLPVLAGPELPHRALAALADQCGPIFALRIGPCRRAVVVSSREIAKELFTVCDTAVLSRPALTAFKYMTYNFALSGLGPNGAYWKQMRKIQTEELLSNSRLELQRHLRESEVRKSFKDLHRKMMAEDVGGGPRLEVELKRWVGDLTLNLMLRMIVGESCSDSVDGGYPHFMTTLREFVHYLGMFVVRDALPFLGWMDIGGHEKAMKRVAGELDVYLQEWLTQRKQDRASGSNRSKREQGFMDVLLSVMDQGSLLNGYDLDTVIKATSLSMITGGTDTTTATVTWAIALLLNHRDILRKAQLELDLYVSKERAVTEKDIEKLVYLQAIVKETMRLCPAAAILPAREFIGDCDVGGYRVQKGTWLMVNAWKIYTDPSVWVEPMEFKPERFLTTNRDIDVKGQNFELFPFGSGRRSCPGMNLGIRMVNLILASFLHALEVSSPGDKPVDMTESFGLSNMKALPLDVIVSPRLSPDVYAL